METVNNNGYISAGLLMNKTIREMREHVEFEKFVCRMLIDNDDTRAMRDKTEEHPDKIHKFIYNNEKIEKHTMKGKMDAIGKSAYIPPADNAEDSNEPKNSIED